MVKTVEEPVFTPRKLRVVCVGAGFSGLTVAYRIKYVYPQMLDYIDLTFYEKNSDIGGTWFENNYPGIACDVPAHIYSFPFEPNPDWSSFYASGSEIWRYMRATTTKYGLDDRTKFNSKIVSTIWNDDIGKWDIKIQQGDTVIDDQADVLINSTGFLNKWKWPDIKGLNDFRGTKVHSANWDTSLDWSQKRVAVIGNGSSAIQILPQMQKTASQITTFIRNPSWIASNFVADFTRDGGNFEYTEEEKQEFRDDPEKLKAYRKKMEQAFNGYFPAFQQDSPLQAAMRQGFEQLMRTRLNNDPELCEKLIPDWHVGCRRITPGDGYLECLQEKNVSIEFGGIEGITSKGIRIKDGRELEFDIIVCATGFDVSFCPSWDLRGKGGAKLDHWRSETPEAYFGICVPEIPNYFMFTGPNSPIGHGSFMPVLDDTTDYILRWIRKIATTGVKSVTVKEDATKEYNEYSQEYLKRMVWSSGCKSWYKNGSVNGPVVAMYAGSVLHFGEVLQSFRTEDFNLEYQDRNRFRFMGNGFTTREMKGGDLAFYIGK